MFKKKQRQLVGQDLAAAAISVSRVELLLEELLAEVRAHRPVNVYEAHSAQATGVEVARLLAERQSLHGAVRGDS